MNKKLLKAIAASLMVCAMAGCTTNKKVDYVAGEITSNDADGLTSFQRNQRRSERLASKLWSSFYDEELNASFTYSPTPDTGEEIASVWHYTSIFSLYVKLVRNNPNDRRLKERLNMLIEGMEYYHEDRTDYRAYAVKRGFDKDKAATGYMVDVYDDNMWIAREFLNAYEVLQDESLLTKCKETIEFCLSGWDTSINPETGEEWGGIYWGPDYLSKHSCSNGPIISTLVKLSKLNPEEEVFGRTYLEWAVDVYDFSIETFKMDNELYGDMIGTEKTAGQTTSHGSLDTTAYTYNTGTMISGGAYLYEATKDERYLIQARRSIEASLEVFGNDEKVEGFYQFPVATTTWFNLTLFQGYYDLLLVDTTASTYTDAIQKSIDFAYNNYLYEDYLPVNWVEGWQYGLNKDEYHDVMDVASTAEVFALLAMKDSIK